MNVLSSPALAQDEDDEEYRSEIVYGLNFNTNGGIIGGAIFKYSQALSASMYQTFGIEVVNVKHPKELRVSMNNNTNTFIAGKQNYLFAVRPQYGRELVLFRKAPDEGVQINAIAAVGPSLGLVKPYYILYSYSTTDVRSERYNPDRHDPQHIIGTGGMFEGFDELKIVPGIHLKAGLSFELSGFRNSVTGFEVGMMLEKYTSDIVLMPNAVNRSFYTSGYLNLFFGSKR
jgi:hypothetical protein